MENTEKKITMEEIIKGNFSHFKEKKQEFISTLEKYAGKQTLNERFILDDDDVAKNEKLKADSEDDKKFIETVRRFEEFTSVFDNIDYKKLKKTASNIKKICEYASKHILKSTNDYFDKLTVKRNTDALEKCGEIFENASKDLISSHQQLLGALDEIELMLRRYYKIDSIPKEERNTPEQ